MTSFYEFYQQITEAIEATPLTPVGSFFVPVYFGDLRADRSFTYFDDLRGSPKLADVIVAIKPKSAAGLRHPIMNQLNQPDKVFVEILTRDGERFNTVVDKEMVWKLRADIKRAKSARIVMPSAKAARETGDLT